MSDTEAIRYRLEALGWQRKYKQLQIETAERLEKLEPWMVEWLYDWEWPKADEIAAAIHHAIVSDNDNNDL